MLKNPIHIVAILTFIVLNTIINSALIAQKNTTTITIENSGRFIGEKQADGSRLTLLVDDVILIQDSTWFYCDSASLDQENNNFDAFGNIHIVMEDSVQLFGNKLFYNGKTKIADIYDNVILIDSMGTLYTDHLIFNRNTNTGVYKTGGRVVDEDKVLTSNIGYYFTKKSEFFFKDDVVLTSPDYVMKSDTLKYNSKTEIVYFHGPTTIVGENKYIFAEDGWYDTQTDKASLKKNAHIKNKEQWIWGDSLYYDKKNGYSFAYSNAYLLDTAKKMAILGNVVEHHKNERFAFATDSALAIIIDGPDSLFMHSDTLKITFDSTETAQNLLAFNKAKFYRHDLQGACDSLIYSFADSSIIMHKEPVLWSDQNQLTSDSIKIFITNNAMDSLVLYNNALIISKDDSTHFNQIKGRDVIAYFKNNELYQILVSGNSESVYYVRDEESKELIGINKGLSSTMKVLIVDKEMREIIYYSEPKHVMYPESEISVADRRLKGFKWLEESRPKSKEEIFN